ncbi:MAG: DF family (seleno)protein [Patescibacteria group bacterium]
MIKQPNHQPNEGLELLYTKDCKAWSQTLANIKQALQELNLTEEIKTVLINTLIEAKQYNFFASPTVHINGQDIDPAARRSRKIGLGYGRPYFYNQASHSHPSVEQIIKALQELYFGKT